MTSKLAALTLTFRQSFSEKASEIKKLESQLEFTPQPDAKLLGEIREKVHFFKGAFGMYGFENLYEICEEIQNDIDSAAIDQAPESTVLSSKLTALIKGLQQHAA